ncbi:CLUMA_CG002841, isoform A [Clunio marinus]|uniref:CLUMA_CG002841, isoform A n=1 Tax=Clunio marinus TaxID=568069 RepID=A0A1J1HLC5_9DIPT|nr:CLUMA_CG002841, isoform A [Clunio marinus]
MFKALIQSNQNVNKKSKQQRLRFHLTTRIPKVKKRKSEIKLGQEHAVEILNNLFIRVMWLMSVISFIVTTVTITKPESHLFSND